jgi:signal peptidase I
MDHPDPPLAAPTPPPQSPADPSSVELPIADELTPVPESHPVAEASGSPQVALPADPQPATPKPHALHASPYRILANLTIVFICCFLFVRVFAVEPFGVPTGSMAPALIGNHREGPCPRCGYPIRIGAPSGGGNPADQYSHVACPNCGKRVSLVDAQDINGDRLLVDKNVFSLRQPRRWEMAVFHCPDTDPKEYRKPYVKRVVGLPGESLLIVDGDVFANGVLLRKTLAELRETRVLVFDMAFAPSGGWGQRWLVDPPENDRRLPAGSGLPALSADSDVVDGGILTLDASKPQSTLGVTYRHWNLDEKREDTIRAWSSYDGVPRSFGQLPAVHNFSFECEIEVAEAFNEATFACRLFDGADAVNAEVSVGPKANGRVILGHDGKEPLGSQRGVSLEVGHTYRVEFSFVNRRVILAIDGKVVLSPFDLPLAAEKRGEVSRPLQLGVRGCKLVIRDLKIYRDTHYTQFGEHGTQHPAEMRPNEYFMLGDNSGNSQDARKWPTPGVPEGEFIGKPFLIHQPLRPARMTIVGQDRLYQTIDFSRLRWLH